MGSRQFISCTITSCPWNETKQCRSPSIIVNKHGICDTKNNYNEKYKMLSDGYVEIIECLNEECDHWELDCSTRKGKCVVGIITEMSFIEKKNIFQENQLCPKCKGTGWVFWYELETYDGPAIKTGTDINKYMCDHKYHEYNISLNNETENCKIPICKFFEHQI